MLCQKGGPVIKRCNVHYGWIIMLMGMLTALGAHGFGRMSYTVILPAMKEGLGLTYTQAGLLGTGNFIGYLVAAFLGGFLASRFNSRYIISFSLVLMGITMFMTGLVRSFEWAFAMRLITGLGNGGAYVPAMALGSVWFTTRYRGFATGITSSGTGIGTMLGAFIVPHLLIMFGAAGWRYAWFCLGALLLVIGMVCFAFLRPRPESIGLGPVGMQLPGEGNGHSDGGDEDGRLRWGLVYKQKAIWHFAAIYFAFGFSYVIYMTFFAAYLKNEIGWTATQASALWAFVGALNIFCGVLWGGISDYLGRKYSAALVYLALAASYLLFALVKVTPAFYISAVLFGLCYSGIPTILAAASGDYVGRRLASAGLGFITLFFGIGQALGPAVGGCLADATQTFSGAFILAGAVSTLGALGSLLLPAPGTHHE
ncbi:MAG: MFS transporter [Ammonifex sp.]|jgi:sugar phosphate permease|nr:MAG: MFS transporter [Ammonifex sp.]